MGVVLGEMLSKPIWLYLHLDQCLPEKTPNQGDHGYICIVAGGMIRILMYARNLYSRLSRKNDSNRKTTNHNNKNIKYGISVQISIQTGDGWVINSNLSSLNLLHTCKSTRVKEKRIVGLWWSCSDWNSLAKTWNFWVLWKLPSINTFSMWTNKSIKKPVTLSYSCLKGLQRDDQSQLLRSFG